jgi:hypothetical protein
LPREAPHAWAAETQFPKYGIWGERGCSHCREWWPQAGPGKELSAELNVWADSGRRRSQAWLHWSAHEAVLVAAPLYTCGAVMSGPA